jgi:hypothetical protein
VKRRLVYSWDRSGQKGKEIDGGRPAAQVVEKKRRKERDQSRRTNKERRWSSKRDEHEIV